MPEGLISSQDLDYFEQEGKLPDNTTTNTKEVADVEPKDTLPSEKEKAEPTVTPIIEEKTTAQPAFDLDAELLKISGGSIKSQSEFADFSERVKKLPDLESRLKSFEDENTSLKEKVNTDPFVNDFTRKLNELYKGGAKESQVQAFIALNKVDNLDSLSPFDAKVLALQMKNGLSAEDAEIYINGTYKLDTEENDEGTIHRENIRLKVDSQADKDFLKTYKSEVSTPPANESQKQQKQFEEQQALLQDEQTAKIQKLTPVAKDISQNIDNYFKGVSLNGKTGDKNIVTDFALSDDSKESVQRTVQQFINNSPQSIPDGEEGVEFLKGFAETLAVKANYKNWIINAASVREKQVREEYHNPTTIHRGTDNVHNGKTNKEALGQWLLDND